MAGKQEQLAVLGLTTHAEWLIERFGPQLGDLLLDLLLKKSQPSALPVLGGIFDVKSLLAMAVEKYGPDVLAKIQAEAAKNGDHLTKLVGDFKDKLSVRGEPWAVVAYAALKPIPDEMLALVIIGAVNRGSDLLLAWVTEWLKSDAANKFLPA